MSVLSERNQAQRLLEGIEDGNLAPDDACEIIRKIDPILAFFVVRYLNKVHGGGHESGQAVIQRLVEITSQCPELPKIMKEGEADSMSEWFDDSYDFKEFRGVPEKFLDIIVDKLES